MRETAPGRLAGKTAFITAVASFQGALLDTPIEASRASRVAAGQRLREAA